MFHRPPRFIVLDDATMSDLSRRAWPLLETLDFGDTPNQLPTEVALVIHHSLNSNRRPTPGDKYGPSSLHLHAAARAEIARGSQSHTTLSSRKLTPPRDF
jgi:hypothetical protein